MRLHIRHSVTKAKRELGAQFEAMLHENTVEVEEDNLDATSDLLSSQLAMLEVSSLPNSPILRQSNESMQSEKNGVNTQILVQNDSSAMDTLNSNMLQTTMMLHKDPSRQSSLQKKLAMMQQKTSVEDDQPDSRHQSSVESNSAPDRYNQTFTAKARVKAGTGKASKAQAAQLASAATVNDNKRNITFKEWTVSMFKQERHSLGTNVD